VTRIASNAATIVRLISIRCSYIAHQRYGTAAAFQSYRGWAGSEIVSSNPSKNTENVAMANEQNNPQHQQNNPQQGGQNKPGQQQQGGQNKPGQQGGQSKPGQGGQQSGQGGFNR
jgi:hypothetical protein